MQLFLLLWKSWKTFYRSKGWLITQIIISLLCWGIAGLSLKQLNDNPELEDSMKTEGKDEHLINSGNSSNISKAFDYLKEQIINEEQPKYYNCTQTGDKDKPSDCVRRMNDTCPCLHPIYCLPCKRVDDVNQEGALVIHELSNRTGVEESGVFEYITSAPCRHFYEPASDKFYDNKTSLFVQKCLAPPVFRFLVQNFGGKEKLNLTVISVQRARSHHSEYELPFMNGFFFFLYLLPIIFFSLQATLEVTQEAKTLIKDYLLSMGMSRTLYFLHHFIFHFVKAWISVAILSAIFMMRSKSMAVDFLLLFTLALASWISLSLVIGSLFKKPANSVILMVFLWLGMILMFFILDISRTNAVSLLCAFNPLYAVYLVIEAKREADFRGESIWFSDIAYAIPQGIFFLLQVIEPVLLFFLAVFIDWIKTSCENPFSSLMLLLKKKKSAIDEQSKRLVDNLEKSEDQNTADLILEGVHKIYSTGFHAVRGVDMKLHKGQVTALLGHNGAGKSTTFSMISGMTMPTKGRIEIMGSESKADRQKYIGFCPQYNAIFPKLTVDEHIEFFGRIKGSKSWKETGQRVLNILGMPTVGFVRAAKLSGGMKRKLCIAISMAADSPIILLDEPTAGLDPGARRDFERLLLEWKKDHTILLTTHYTDEAELLADRIFIMAKGKVFCSGSPQFLRKKFDSGYVLSFAVNKEADTEKSSEEMIKLVKEFVPDVSLYKNRGRQFELKLSTDDTTSFPEMFRKIEADGPIFGMQSYGLSQNQLEQVFLKVGEMTGTVDRTAEVRTALNELIQENDKRAQGPMKILRQFGNTMLKRLMFDLRHMISMIIVMIAIFALTYAIFWTCTTLLMLREIKREGVSDYLEIEDRYLIGVHSSVTSQTTTQKIEQIARKYGKYLMVVDMNSNFKEWYKANALKRPPILGAISKSVNNSWIITIPEHHEEYLPTLESIVAQINNFKQMQFNVKPVKYDLSRLESAVIGDLKKFQNFALIRIALPLLLIFVTPLIVIRPISFFITERVSNYAHQERLTGVNRVVFLFSSMIYDFLLYLIHFFVFLGACFVAHSETAWKIIIHLVHLPPYAFLSGELIILLFYRLFATRAKGFLLILLLLMFADLISFVTSIVLMLFGYVKKNTAFLNYSELMPHHLLSPMLAALMWSDTDSKELKFVAQKSNLNWKSGGKIYGSIYITLHYLLLIAVLVLIELRLWRLCKRRNAEDPGDSLVLRVNNLQKWYGKGKNRKDAVNGITFGVRAHECFGVLGINGAGKTSTFEMITGNTLPSGGLATVGGVDCSKAPTIGYCPQTDALMEDLSGRQSLVILAALHGYENPNKVADIVITCVGMQDHADKRTGNYSGGQRRKISVAASLLAQNSLIILDEPTAGIDPIARRDIWSVICALRESTNTAIVLTSHSMDEVEALVSNLIIMRDGSVVVEGSPQMIKNQFGGHYNFNLVMDNVSNIEEVTSQVRTVFPAAFLYDSASLRNIKYKIPRLPSDVFSSLFEKASTIADQLNATSFCFTHATLEDAFMLAATSAVPLGPSLPRGTYESSTDRADAPREATAVTGSDTVSGPHAATAPSSNEASSPEEKTPPPSDSTPEVAPTH